MHEGAARPAELRLRALRGKWCGLEGKGPGGRALVCHV